jgi:hypothetical protein
LRGAATLYDELRFGPERARMPLVFGFRLQDITSALPEARDLARTTATRWWSSMAGASPATV